MIYKFVKWDVPKLEDLKGIPCYNLHDKVIKNCEKLNRQEKDYLFKELNSNAYSKTGIPRHGWMFDFSVILKRFFVKFKYGHIQEYFAPDKTSIRNNLSAIANIVKV